MSAVTQAARAHATMCSAAEKFAPLLLLGIRLYWGWQFMVTGLGKLRNQEKVVEFFTSLNIPLPALNAHFVSGLEFFGGILLLLGLFTRPVALLLTGSMFVAYWTADHDALLAIFSDSEKFYSATPYPFLFAIVVLLVFGAGAISLDALIARRFRPYMNTRGANAVAS